MKIPFSFIKPSGPPPFDLASLDLSLYLKAGSSLYSYTTPANGGAGVVIWQGTPSAGISGTIDATSASLNAADVDGTKTLDGKLTLNFSAANLGTRQLALSIGDAAVRAGGVGTETQITDHIASGILTATDGSEFALIWLNTISGNSGDDFDQGVIGASLYGNLMVGGAGNDKGEIGMGFGAIVQTPLLGTPTGAWFLLQGRYGGSVKEVRVNKGAWATAACGAASGHIMKIGSNVSSSADMFMASAGASTTRYNDATFDDIYDGLKALYPGAALP